MWDERNEKCKTFENIIYAGKIEFWSIALLFKLQSPGSFLFFVEYVDVIHNIY
jgi:hypothetical protein